MARSLLTKKDFDKVIRAVKAGGNNAAIARSTGFSAETVRVIRLARTWKGYNELKKARNAKGRAATKIQKARSNKAADNKLQKKLNNVPNEPLTPAYAKELLDSMQEQRLATESLIAATEKQTTAISNLQRFQSNGFFKIERAIDRIKRVWWSRR